MGGSLRKMKEEETSESSKTRRRDFLSLMCTVSTMIGLLGLVGMVAVSWWAPHPGITVDMKGAADKIATLARRGKTDEAYVLLNAEIQEAHHSYVLSPSGMIPLVTGMALVLATALSVPLQTGSSGSRVAWRSFVRDGGILVYLGFVYLEIMRLKESVDLLKLLVLELLGG